jgi:uncharacterized protein YgiM (DUF1202 family)
MRKLSSRQKLVAVTTCLSLAVAAFPTFSTTASRAIPPQNIQPSVSGSTSFHEDGYHLAQVANNCRQVAASDGLQVRQQPSVNSTVIGFVENGKQVAIKNSGASGWVPIYAPLNGFVSAAYLKYCASTSTPTPAPSPTPTPTPAPTSTPTSSSSSCRRVLASGGLQVRQQPSIGSTVVGVVADGQNVTIKNSGASGWVPISAPLQGYVSAAYLRYCPAR